MTDFFSHWSHSIVSSSPLPDNSSTPSSDYGFLRSRLLHRGYPLVPRLRRDQASLPLLPLPLRKVNVLPVNQTRPILPYHHPPPHPPVDLERRPLRARLHSSDRASFAPFFPIVLLLRPRRLFAVILPSTRLLDVRLPNRRRGGRLRDRRPSRDVDFVGRGKVPRRRGGGRGEERRAGALRRLEGARQASEGGCQDCRRAQEVGAVSGKKKKKFNSSCATKS